MVLVTRLQAMASFRIIFLNDKSPLLICQSFPKLEMSGENLCGQP